MTYEGIFEKCRTISELHQKYTELKKDPLADVNAIDCKAAYMKRKDEIRKQYQEQCFG